AVADLHRRDPIADGEHAACDLAAGDERQRRLQLVLAAHDQSVDEVHPGGFHVDQDRARRDRRLVDFLDGKVLERPELTAYYAAHSWPSTNGLTPNRRRAPR